jgi:hypothetical protein
VAAYFAERNAAEAERQKSQSAVAKMVSGAKAVKSGMDATARFLDKHLLGEDPLAVSREKNNQQMDLRAQAFDRWTQPPATETTLQSTPVSSEKAPRSVPLVRERLPIPPSRGSENPAREYVEKNILNGESQEDQEMMELQERASALEIERMTVELAREKLKVQELELALRRREIALATKMRKRNGPSASGAAALKIP